MTISKARMPSCLTVFTLMSLIGQIMYAQSFSSGSSGSDGALNLTTPGTILFDPKSFKPPLDPDGDNVYHFTTINVVAGVTVKLSAKVINAPIFWLATGNVQIDGTVDLDGEDGKLPSSLTERIASEPGSGGYSGGLAGFSAPGVILAGQPGSGPGRGLQCDINNQARWAGSSPFLVPLIGGSGGGGCALSGGGGAGGGALLVASSGSLVVNGKITSAGGAGDNSRAGSGGAIRLLANQMSGSGVLQTVKESNRNPGAIRLEAFTFSGSILASATYSGTPFNTFLPPASASGIVRITSIAGSPVPATPLGTFVNPDMRINSSGAVTFEVEAKNIPIGTVVKLYIASDSGNEQTVDTSALQGSLALSTATASIVLPTGFSLASVRATWTQ